MAVWCLKDFLRCCIVKIMMMLEEMVWLGIVLCGGRSGGELRVRRRVIGGE